MDQNNAEVPNKCSQSNDGVDISDDAAKHCLPTSESPEIPSPDGTENYNGSTEGDLDFGHTNLQNEQYPLDANTETMNAKEFSNGNNDDNDCCKCSNSPLMCLAFFCDCFGL